MDQRVSHAPREVSKACGWGARPLPKSTRAARPASVAPAIPLVASLAVLTAAAQAAPATPGEVVERPEPGLARGRWEAPTWFFYAVAVAAIVAGVAWVATSLRARRKGGPR
jgi:hypothetical protein